MHSNYVEAMGLLAAALTTTAFLPQLIRTWRTGGHDLSYYMLAIFLTGVALWLLYGIAIGAIPVILANVLTALQVVAIIVVKFVRAAQASRQRNTAPEAVNNISMDFSDSM